MSYARAIGVRYRKSWLVRDFHNVISKYIHEGDSILFIPAGRYRYNTLVQAECFYLDKDPKVLEDVDKDHRFVLDMLYADKKLERTFDVVVADPPYTLPYHLRTRFLKALSNLARRTIITKWNIIPRFGPDWKLEEIYIYESQRWWTYASIIAIFVRRGDSQC